VCFECVECVECVHVNSFAMRKVCVSMWLWVCVSSLLSVLSEFMLVGLH